MKKLYSVVLFALTALLLSTGALADIAPLPRPEPEPSKSPVLFIVIVVVVIAAAAILFKVLRSKKK
jgi:hypothetical protein